MSETIIKSSGNIFIDLGYSPEDAAILQMRADLMAKLRKFIQAKKLTQANAAKILCVSQSRISDLIRGKWERFSLENGSVKEKCWRSEIAFMVIDFGTKGANY
jgi:predicted XRE-type DNA-binding protein